MELSIVLTTILSTFATTAPDLCDIAYTDAAGDPYTDSFGRALARYCAWAGPDAPVWDGNVCCEFDTDGAACTVADGRGGCQTGAQYYCERGAATASGGVVCYQPFPSMCDAGPCVAPPAEPPLEAEMFVACCSAGGACMSVSSEDAEDCMGGFVTCSYGMQYIDGTVDCWD